MFRVLMLLTLLPLLLWSRENPFEPVFDEHAFPIANNKPLVLKPLRYERVKLPDTARSVTRIIVEYKNLDGSIEQKIKKLNKRVDWHMPIVITHKQKKLAKAHFVKKADIGSVSFFTKGRTMLLVTKNKLLRHFMMAHPYRVVIDLQGEIPFLAKKIGHLPIPFTRIRMGNHKGYYRIVVELDGQYEYQLSKVNKGYELVIR